VTLESDGSKTVYGNLGPDPIYAKITPSENGTLQMHGTVGPFTWEQIIEPLPRKD